MGEKFLEILLRVWEWLIPFTVVDQYERAVLLRLGRFHRILDPGFHWLIPFGVDRAVGDNVVDRLYDLREQSLTTSDGKQVVVRGVVLADIRDIYKATLGVEHADNAINDSCLGIIMREVTTHTWDELRMEAFIEGLTAACRRNAFRYGFEIKRVQLSDLTTSPSLRVFGFRT